jgi:hypothetical protein
VKAERGFALQEALIGVEQSNSQDQGDHTDHAFHNGVLFGWTAHRSDKGTESPEVVERLPFSEGFPAECQGA